MQPMANQNMTNNDQTKSESSVLGIMFVIQHSKDELLPDAASG